MSLLKIRSACIYPISIVHTAQTRKVRQNGVNILFMIRSRSIPLVKQV